MKSSTQIPQHIKQLFTASRFLVRSGDVASNGVFCASGVTAQMLESSGYVRSFIGKTEYWHR